MCCGCQDQMVYQKNQLRTRLEKDMVPEVNIISVKASVVSGNRAGGSGCSESLSRDYTGESLLRKFLGSKEHLD